ncbi:hypothetical protein [uncultured Phascolarctobacterium sp.]|uniref:hypothetical protein n=1 Tax=uncultured Phascolarctobacterium sp. TaxID=512296 RepID=UPI0025D254C7|nr:hypothetical protein [uncultured Phascolarctobacterium sp.]
MKMNPAIKDKVDKYSYGDKQVAQFLMDIIKHETEGGQYSKQYRKLIQDTVDKGE